MVKIRNKIFSLIILLLSIFLLSSCDLNKDEKGDGKEYSILYIDGENLLDLEPRMYTSGVETSLPVINDEAFIGWYDNKNFDGKVITKIDASSTGNLIFYAKYNESIEKTYTVIFKNYNGDILKEEKVKENSSATAPADPSRNGYEFIGWSEDFSNVTKDMVIYANYKESVGNISLVSYLENTFYVCRNFKLTYGYVDNTGEDKFEETYLYDGNKLLNSFIDEMGDEYNDYLEIADDVIGEKNVYYCDNGDGTYDLYDEGSLEYEGYISYWYFPLFDSFDDNYFDFSNNCFTAKSIYVDNLAKDIIGDYEGETYTELKLYIDDNYVTKIIAKSKLTYEGLTYTYDYKIELSNFNKVEITLPSPIEKIEESISSISNIYTVVKGTEFNEVLNDISIILNYSDGTSINLNNNDCVFEHNFNKDVINTYLVNVSYNGLNCSFNIEVVEELKNVNIEDYLANMNNYKYVYSYSDPNFEPYSANVWYNNGIFKFEVADEYGDLYYDYLYLDENNLFVYLYDNGDGTYETIYEEDSEFYDYYSYLDIIDFYYLESKDFTFSNNCFTANSNSVHEVASNLMGAFEGDTYKSLKIYVDATKITKIVAVSEYVSNGSTYSCTFNISFSNVGSTNISLPNGVVTEKVEVGISANATNINVVRGTSFDAVLDKVLIKLNYSNGSSVILNNKECEFSHNYSSSTLGSYEVKVKYNDFECTFKVNVLEEVDIYEVVDDTVVILEDVLDEMGEYDGVVYGVTKGLRDNSNVLVIPIDFTDYKADSQMQEVLEIAFFGTSEETGWESLTSYYNKASYGKCNITGTVLPVFSTGNSSTYYDSLDDDTAVNSIIKAALEYYDSSINYDEYDTDGDNYIDAIYLVYTAPIDYESDDSLYWAFTYQYFTDDYEYYDNVEADFYCFMGYDFLFETLSNGNKVKYNAETIIHESGHLFGLDDYYDYEENKGPDGGVGGGDMMDYNVGDHNPFSKMLLGWVTPKVIDANNINTDITVTLNSFGQSGECLVICNGWENSYFDEYYVIDFYTPDGLNALEAGYSGLFSVSGIRIYHIDATLNNPSNVSSVWDVYKSNNSNTSHKLIQLVQADGLNEIENDNAYSDNEDLFQVNDKYSDIKWYDNSSCKFEIVVNAIGTSSATITINYIG